MRATLRLLCRRRRQAHKDTDEPQRVCAIGTARTERPNSASENFAPEVLDERIHLSLRSG